MDKLKKKIAELKIRITKIELELERCEQEKYEEVLDELEEIKEYRRACKDHYHTLILRKNKSGFE